MHRPTQTIPCLILAVVTSLAAATIGAAEEPADGPTTVEEATTTAIPPDEALAHVNEECTVEFVVQNGRKLDDKNICFLNSLQDHRESGNFTAVIRSAGLTAFADEGVDDPVEKFLGKKIQVSGLIVERAGQAQVVVESPTQIVVVEGEPAAGEGEPAAGEGEPALGETEPAAGEAEAP